MTIFIMEKPYLLIIHLHFSATKNNLSFQVALSHTEESNQVNLQR